MTYKEHICKAMELCAADPAVRVIGYNTRYGSRGGGTLTCFPPERCIEMPIAENLMVGMAIGMSLKGYKPIVYFERFDFVINALDAIVNHLGMMDKISEGEFKPMVILRIVVGNHRNPLYTGPTHTADYSVPLQHCVEFPVQKLVAKYSIEGYYKMALSATWPTALIEYKDLYGSE